MSIVLSLILTGISGLLGPWWLMLVGAFFIGAWRAESVWGAWGLGLLGVGAWWLMVPLYTHLVSEGILTARLAALAALPMPVLVLVLTALIGGGMGGLAAVTGYQGRLLLRSSMV